MPKFLTPLQLIEVPTGVDPAASGYDSLHGLSFGPAYKGSDGSLSRLFDVVQGRVASDLTNSTTTLADMTGLSLPVVAAGHYYFEFSGTYSSSASGCYIAAGANGPSTGSNGVSCNLHLHVDNGADTWHNGCTTSFGSSNTPAFVGTANVAIPWRIYGYAHIGATGGNLAPQFARNSGAGTITIQAGAWGWVWRLA